MDQFSEYEEVLACPLCGGQSLECVFQESHIKGCTGCGLVLTSPRPTFNAIRESYSDEHFYDDWILNDEGRERLWKKRYRRVRKYIGPHSRLLDYSAGIGTFLHLVKAEDHCAYGTEISESARRFASSRYGIELVREEDFRWEEYQDFFDVITAWHVVEHVGNPRRLLSLFYGVLKTQGILVLSVPNKDYVPLSRLLLNREYPLHSRYPRLLPGKEIHLSHFDMDTVLKLLEATHFRIIELGIDYHYAAPNWRAFSKYWLYNALLKISGLNYSETVFAVARKPPSDPQTL